MPMVRPARGYEGEAGRALAERYETVDPAVLHQALVPHLPPAPAAVLDVGAGSGRDVAWLAGQGYSVLAVEPSATMRAEGQRRHPRPGITWMADSLPGLDAVFRLGAAFDVILLSAVWMHIPPGDRPRAFQAGHPPETRRHAGRHSPPWAARSGPGHASCRCRRDRGARARP
jgi:SAM-dependent methyltransferase